MSRDAFTVRCWSAILSRMRLPDDSGIHGLAREASEGAAGASERGTGASGHGSTRQHTSTRSTALWTASGRFPYTVRRLVDA